MNATMIDDNVPTKLDRYRFGTTMLSVEQGTAEMYSKFTVYVPEGTVPEVRPLSDEEADGVAKLYEDHDVPLPNRLVQFSHALVLPNDVHDEPMVFRGEKGTGLNLYVNENYEVEPNRDLSYTIAAALLGEDNVQPDPDSAQSPRFNATNISLALRMLAAVGGEKPSTHDVKLTSESEFAGVNLAKFTGTVATIRNIGGRQQLRLYENFKVLYEPGTKPVWHDMQQEDRDAFASAFPESSFKPVGAWRFTNVGVAEDEEDGQPAIGTGDVSVLAATREQSYEVHGAWVPKAPFDHLGYTNYLRTKVGIPTTEEREAMKAMRPN